MRRLYELVWRPAAAVIARTDAMTAHARTISLMRALDDLGPAVAVAQALSDAALPKPRQPVYVGGVHLPHPTILAAGLVKGDGFATEEEALVDALRLARGMTYKSALAGLDGGIEISNPVVIQFMHMAMLAGMLVQGSNADHDSASPFPPSGNSTTR